MYTWMSNVLSVPTDRQTDRQEIGHPSRQTSPEMYGDQGCRGICMAAIRHQGLNLCGTSFIFIFGIVGLQTKHVSKVRRVQYHEHTCTCTIKVQSTMWFNEEVTGEVIIYWHHILATCLRVQYQLCFKVKS